MHDNDWQTLESVINEISNNDSLYSSDKSYVAKMGTDGHFTVTKVGETGCRDYNDEIDDIYNSLDGLRFGQNSEGNWGYIPSGADTVIPFKTGDYKVYMKHCTIDEGTWSGVTLSDSSWKALATSSVDSSFTFYHNLNLDIDSNTKKIKFLSMSICEGTYWIRQTRSGNSTDGYSYRYTPYICMSGFSDSGCVTDSLYYGKLHYINNSDTNKYIQVRNEYSNYAVTSSTYNSAVMHATLRNNSISLSFSYYDAFSLLIKSTSPTFDIIIIYED